MTGLYRIVRPIVRVFPPLIAVSLLALAGLVTTGHLRLAPILTGSMTPKFPVGTLVAATPVAATQLRVGDVIMFVPPRPYGTPTGGPVMHRLVSVTHGPDGHLQFRTKGDANVAKDPWTLDGNAGGFARLRASSVVAGRMLLLVRHTGSGPALLIWPGLLLLWLALRRSRRGPGEKVQPAPSGSAERYQPKHAAA